jgi:methyl-accepting chemotaxis protein
MNWHRRIPFSTKITILSVVGTALVAVAVASLALLFVADDWRARTIKRHEGNLQIVIDYINPTRAAWSVKDGHLFAGDLDIEANGSAVLDKVKDRFGDGTVASIFKGDTRVATTVIGQDGKRALGSKFTKGEIEDIVYRQGKRFQGDSTVVGIPFLIAYEPVRDSAGTIIGAVGIGMPLSDYYATVRDLIIRVISGAVIVTLLVAGATFFLIRKGLSPVRNLSATLGEIARGNMDVVVPDTDLQDEIGQIAQSVENLRSTLLSARETEAKHQAEEHKRAEKRAQLDKVVEGFVANIDRVVTQVDGAAQQMRKNAEKLTALSGNTVSRVTESVGQVEETSSNMQFVAAAAEELTSSIREINTQVVNSANYIDRAKTEANETSQMVRGLASAVARIGEVVTLINGIAAQTNLLALNATIEAARAGEAGRGFAVVANEVKTLANQTGKATEEISSQIAEIQAETENTVNAIMKVLNRIDEIHGSTTSMVASVQQQQSATQEIVSTVHRVSSSAQKTAANVASVRDDSEEVGTGASQVLEAATNLLQHSNGLQKDVTEFVRQVREG